MLETLADWKQRIAEKYQTSTYLVVPANSFTAWGYGKTKIFCCTVRSPRDGAYSVFHEKKVGTHHG